MVTLASVLQVSCFHVLIGGEREHPSAQPPLIVLSGRGFSRVPGSLLTARSLSFSLRFSDGSGHARECPETKLQDAINEGGSPRSLFGLAPSVTRMVIFVSRAFCLTDKEKGWNSRSLGPFYYPWEK